MTWAETIELIRTKPDYKDLVRLAYFDADLQANVRRFGENIEYKETLSLIRSHHPEAKSILDIGSGNGISAVNFALTGFKVTALEPDTSNTIGAGAIRILKEQYKLDNLDIVSSYAEDMNFQDDKFDVVYMRQAMHHANDLQKFVKESIGALKLGGLFVSVRDHVIFSPKDKDWFLTNHPLHKFYGGENAYSPDEYRNAIEQAGAQVIEEFKYFDHIINYHSMPEENIEKLHRAYIIKVRKQFNNKFGVFAKLPFSFQIYKLLKPIDIRAGLDERKIPGRLYTYIARKS